LQAAIKKYEKLRLHRHSDDYQREHQLSYASNLLPYLSGRYIQSLVAAKDCMATVMACTMPTKLRNEQNNETTYHYANSV
jgi:hypothetical protein